MNEKNGKDLVPRNGRPGEVAEQRTYTVNMAAQPVVNTGRKKDWLDYVGAFLEDPEPNRDKSFTGFLRAWKEKPGSRALAVAPALGLLAVGFFCGMDTYHWDFAKENHDFMHNAMPLGDKLTTLIGNATTPAFRPRPGESAEATQRRRDCLTAVVDHVDGRYLVAEKQFPRAPLDFCETSEGLTPPVKSEGRSR
jgi:hypothetical protein